MLNMGGCNIPAGTPATFFFWILNLKLKIQLNLIPEKMLTVIHLSYGSGSVLECTQHLCPQPVHFLAYNSIWILTHQIFHWTIFSRNNFNISKKNKKNFLNKITHSFQHRPTSFSNISRETRIKNPVGALDKLCCHLSLNWCRQESVVRQIIGKMHQNGSFES